MGEGPTDSGHAHELVAPRSRSPPPKARQHGKEQHRVNEAYLAWEDPWPKNVPWPPVPGFRRVLAKHPTWDIYRTELTLVDYGLKLPGQADALFRCRETGKIKLVDYKFWTSDPETVYKDEATGELERGCHPLTWDREKCTLSETEIQLNFYASILEKPRNGYGLVIDEMIVWWFDPADTMAFREYVIPRIDVEAFYAAFIDQGPLPMPPALAMPPNAMPESVPRPVPGPTTIVHITRELQQGTVWTGRAYVKNGWTLGKSKWDDPRRPFQRAHTPAELKTYERSLLKNPALMDAIVGELWGQQLTCWCAEGQCGCHCQVLRDYANYLGGLASM